MIDRAEKLRVLVREHRRLRGLTQKQVAEAIGISRLAYHRVENGEHRLPGTLLAKICPAIGCDPDALLREAGYTSLKEEK